MYTGNVLYNIEVTYVMKYTKVDNNLRFSTHITLYNKFEVQCG